MAEWVWQGRHTLLLCLKKDTNLHDKLKLLSLQISDEPHLLLNTDSADFSDLLAQSKASV